MAKGQISRSIEHVALHYVPAESGWRHGSAYKDDDGFTKIMWVPIIAWQIDSYKNDLSSDIFANVAPITEDGDTWHENQTIVKRPDGSIYIWCVADFNNEAELIEYLDKGEEDEKT